MRVRFFGCWVAWGMVAGAGFTASAQTAWDVLEDGQSDSICGVVNAVNSDTGAPIQLVILTETSQLMMVSRTDTILADTFVEGDNDVTDLGQARGFIEFATDGDGFRTVWWVALDGMVVEVDPFNGTITAGVEVPENFINVPCDACEFVDFPPDDVCFVDDGGVIPPIVINLCGMGTSAMVPMSLIGLGGMALMRRRW
ncbi:MAG: hypothetical protein HOP29_05600 [Phycisphaerales bacterium]|nr:hypothetical protein [Phycisphaerales bacterium]